MFPHPCFDETAHEYIGRVHLPVAPLCNIQCAFCERRVCVNITEQHPGWARKLLSPLQALELVDRLVLDNAKQLTNPDARPQFVVGVAGPGEPLANKETFEALALVHEKYPFLRKCISTNGLMLEKHLPQLLDVGISSLTVTVNAPDGVVGSQVYLWVRERGTVLKGIKAAEFLIQRQMQGIQAALTAGLMLKVNTVLVPGVNDMHITRLAKMLNNMGVRLMNIMPLIPGGALRNARPPTCRELQDARTACEEWVPQFRACEQCSADVIRMPNLKASDIPASP
jgi:nitrogen fixation protein NifB